MGWESVLCDSSLIGADPLFTAHFDLPTTRRAPSQARRLVADALSRPSAPVGAAQFSYTAQLLVSELVTNAVMHARTEVHLGISGDVRTLLFAVADGHPDPPPDPHTAITGQAYAAATGQAAEFPLAESGRGIIILVALATDFGWRRCDDGTGKVIWFTLAIPAALDQ